MSISHWKKGFKFKQIMKLGSEQKMINKMTQLIASATLVVAIILVVASSTTCPTCEASKLISSPSSRRNFVSDSHFESPIYPSRSFINHGHQSSSRRHGSALDTAGRSISAGRFAMKARHTASKRHAIKGGDDSSKLNKIKLSRARSGSREKSEKSATEAAAAAKKMSRARKMARAKSAARARIAARMAARSRARRRAQEARMMQKVDQMDGSLSGKSKQGTGSGEDKEKVSLRIRRHVSTARQANGASGAAANATTQAANDIPRAATAASVSQMPNFNKQLQSDQVTKQASKDCPCNKKPSAKSGVANLEQQVKTIVNGTQNVGSTQVGQLNQVGQNVIGLLNGSPIKEGTNSAISARSTPSDSNTLDTNLLFGPSRNSKEQVDNQEESADPQEESQLQFEAELNTPAINVPPSPISPPKFSAGANVSPAATRSSSKPELTTKAAALDDGQPRNSESTSQIPFEERDVEPKESQESRLTSGDGAKSASISSDVQSDLVSKLGKSASGIIGGASGEADEPVELDLSSDGVSIETPVEDLSVETQIDSPGAKEFVHLDDKVEKLGHLKNLLEPEASGEVESKVELLQDLKDKLKEDKQSSSYKIAASPNDIEAHSYVESSYPIKSEVYESPKVAALPTACRYSVREIQNVLVEVLYLIERISRKFLSDERLNLKTRDLISRKLSKIRATTEKSRIAANLVHLKALNEAVRSTGLELIRLSSNPAARRLEPAIYALAYKVRKAYANFKRDCKGTY